MGEAAEELERLACVFGITRMHAVSHMCLEYQKCSLLSTSTYVEDYYALLTESLMRMKENANNNLEDIATNILMVPDSVFREESETELTGHIYLKI